MALLGTIPKSLSLKLTGSTNFGKRNLFTRLPDEVKTSLMNCASNRKSNIPGAHVAYVGGFGGIGFACCVKLVCKGIKSLVILDVNENCPLRKYLHDINPKLDFKFVRLDLANGKDEIEEALEKTHQHLGCMDYLINGSALINDRNPKKTLDVNLLGLVETTLTAIPYMSKGARGKGGTIVHIASVFGLEPGHFAAVYTAAKHGVVGFSRAMAAEDYFDVTRINHIVICPGITMTGKYDSFVGLDTLDISKKMSETYFKAKNQTTEECALGIINAIEKGKNGSIWIIDKGDSTEVKMKHYWDYSFDE